MKRATRSKAPTRAAQRLSIALAAVSCAMAIAACGSSASQPTAPADRQLALSECRRGHGVPNFPDPTFPAGGGVSSGGPAAGQNPRAPAVEKAAKACANVGTAIPGGG